MVRERDDKGARGGGARGSLGRRRGMKVREVGGEVEMG